MNLPSCQCGCLPCRCQVPTDLCMDSPVNPTPTCCTVCTGNTSNNMFWEAGTPPFPGKCKLDNMTYEQVIGVLRRSPMAKRDLIRITDDPTLLALANTVPLTKSELDDAQEVMKRLERNSLPFYTVLHGNFDGTPNGRR